jgi:hypothetical protein
MRLILGASLAVFVSVVACSSDGTSTPASSGPGDGTVEQACVDKINALRATLNLAPLARWTEQEVCSDGEAKSDSESGKAHGAFGTCTEMAQNECPGWPGPPADMIGKCLDMMWAEGPGADFSKHGHYINMTSTKYTKVACGFYTTPKGSIWSVQNFR